MERWIGRVAVVTGASSGIGAALCKALADDGMKVVGCARRLEKIEEAASGRGNVFPYKCDVSEDAEVEALFKWVEEHPDLGKVDVCIANAGFKTSSTLLEGTASEWRRMMDVNVIGLNHCTQLAVKSMLKHRIDDGHVVFVNSLSGHRVAPGAKTKFYNATKFAVTALLEGWRQEIGAMRPKNNIRVSQLSPGLVRTEFHDVAHDHDKARAEAVYKNIKQPLTADDMADAIKYILQVPAHVQIDDILVRPTSQTS